MQLIKINVCAALYNLQKAFVIWVISIFLTFLRVGDFYKYIFHAHRQPLKPKGSGGPEKWKKVLVIQSPVYRMGSSTCGGQRGRRSSRITVCVQVPLLFTNHVPLSFVSTWVSYSPHRAFLRLTEKRGNGKVWCGLELDKCLFITMLHHFFSNCLVTMTAQGPPGSSHLFSPVLPTSRAYVYFFPLFPNWMLSEARECGLLVQGNFKQWMIGEMSKYCPQNGPKA